MKTFLLLCSVTLACKAGDFVNLTFDEPDLSGPLTEVHPGGPQIGKTAQLLRGWTLSINDRQPETMTYSPPGTSSTGVVALEEYKVGPNGSQFSQFELIVNATPPAQQSLTLRQTGTIPLDAAKLGLFSNGLVEVRINDKAIYLADPEVTAYPLIDISAFAGQTVSLEFRAAQLPFRPVGFNFDIAGFYPIPEPSTWALLGTGLAAMLWFSRRR